MTSQYYQSIIKVKCENMNFLNFLTQSTSMLNFNLSSIVNGIGFGGSSVEMSTPKMINTEQIIKQPTETEQNSKEKPSEPESADLNCKESQVQLFTKQQQLINQYMHLNIQLLSKKLQNLEHVEKIPKKEEIVSSADVKSNKKKIKKVNNCGHNDREHYAKGMCSNCYHKYGRTKKPWNCPHDKLYANGMCQNCYINTYNRKRREEKNQEEQMPSELKVEEELQE